MVACAGLGARLREIETGTNTEVEVWVPFSASDWDGLFLSVIRAGVPGVGQVGPHGLPLETYDVTVYQDEVFGWQRDLDVDVRTNLVTGEVLLIRCARSRAFSGRVVIDWARRYV